MGRCSCTNVKTTSLFAIICDLQMHVLLIIIARWFTCLNLKGRGKRWGTTSGDKLLPDRYWQLGFVGARGRGWGKCPLAPSGSGENDSQYPDDC